MAASASMWWPLLCTLLIIGFILIVAWWLKYTGLAPSSGIQGRLKIHARCALGPREQLVVVQVEDRCLLLGVTSQSIQVLDRFEASDDLSAASAPPSLASFSTVLNRLRQRNVTPSSQSDSSTKEPPLS